MMPSRKVAGLVLLALASLSAAQNADCVSNSFEGQVSGTQFTTIEFADGTIGTFSAKDADTGAALGMKYCDFGAPTCGFEPADAPSANIINTGEVRPAGNSFVTDAPGTGAAAFYYIDFDVNGCVSARDFSVLIYDHANDGGSQLNDRATLTVYGDVARTNMLAQSFFPTFESIPDGASLLLSVDTSPATPICAVSIEFFRSDGVTHGGDVGLGFDNVAWNCRTAAPPTECTVQPSCGSKCFTLTNDGADDATFEYAQTKSSKASGSVISSTSNSVFLAAGASQEFCSDAVFATEYASFSAQVSGQEGICSGELRDCPDCTVPKSEWLVTEFETFLNVPDTGFKTGQKDIFRFAFDYHRKYYDRVFNTGADNALETEAVTEHSKKTDPSDPDYACWDSIELDIAWGDLVPFCHRDDASDPAFVLYTCKVTATGLEDLDPIRSVDLTRLVHHELPVIVQFPKQVTASYAGLSAFQPPNVLAAIVRQEVNVDVSNLDVAATVRLYTSVQYPFRLVNPVWDSASGAAFPTGIQAGVAPSMFTDCTPFPEGGDSPGQPGDEFACNQVWNLDLDVIGGANPSQSVCSLDGTYLFAWQAECLSTFPSDCPLVPDDLGQIQNKFAISFTLDSEYFCPQVVDTVDVAATMAPYKDIAHAVAATNFILGQTLYLVADVTSSKVTVAAAQLDDLSYDNGAGAVAVITDKAATGNALSALAWFNSGESPAGTSLTVPANQVWIQFLVSDPPFAPPVDGSQDFSVSVVLDVQFKDASVALLQVAGSKTGSRQLGAKAASSVSDGNDDGETAAGHKMQKKLAFTVSTVAAAGAALNFA